MAEDFVDLVSHSSSEEEGDQYDENDGADDENRSSGDDTDSSKEVASDSDADDDSDYGENVDDEDSLVEKVVRLLKEGGDLKALKLKECKAYLRKQGLRITGAKAVCIERICEHWRIKDGNGEELHPRVGKPKGERTVAGKVVKESYGSAKQQHTFTASLTKVEVLWSTGAQELAPLHPLLVKGRNLYKMRTFRQPWEDEAKRAQVLAEKHRRGAKARRVREARRVKMTSAKAGAGTRKTRGTEKAKHAIGHAHVPLPGQKTSKNHHWGAFQTAQPSNSSQWHHIPRSPRPMHTALHPYPYHGQNPYGHREHFNRRAVLFYNAVSTSSTVGFAYSGPCNNPGPMPVSNQGRFSHNRYAHQPAPNPSSYNHGKRDLKDSSELMIHERERVHEGKRDRFWPVRWPDQNGRVHEHGTIPSSYDNGARDRSPLSQLRIDQRETIYEQEKNSLGPVCHDNGHSRGPAAIRLSYNYKATDSKHFSQSVISQRQQIYEQRKDSFRPECYNSHPPRPAPTPLSYNNGARDSKQVPQLTTKQRETMNEQRKHHFRPVHWFNHNGYAYQAAPIPSNYYNGATDIEYFSKLTIGDRGTSNEQRKDHSRPVC